MKIRFYLRKRHNFLENSGGCLDDILHFAINQYCQIYSFLSKVAQITFILSHRSIIQILYRWWRHISQNGEIMIIFNLSCARMKYLHYRIVSLKRERQKIVRIIWPIVSVGERTIYDTSMILKCKVIWQHCKNDRFHIHFLYRVSLFLYYSSFSLYWSQLRIVFI